MKQINIVRNTIENGSRLTRLKSRIVSASSRVWLAFAPILLVVFGLFGVNENAWGYWHVAYYCSADAYVRPANTGYVWVTVKGSSFDGNFSQGEHDDSNHDDAIWGGGFLDGNKKAPSTYGITAQFYAKAEKGDYKFKGWYNNANGTGSPVSTSTTSNCSYSTTINATKSSPGPNLTLYAIYAKYKTTTTEIDFGEVAYKSAAQSRTFTIDCHNVGTWSNPSGLSGVFGASLSGNSNDNTQQTCTVTVTLDPKTAGTYNQTLTVSTSRGGSIQVTVKAKVTATPSYTWNTSIWNANGSMKRAVYVGETINDVVSTLSNGTKNYSIENWTPTGNNNEGATMPTFVNNTLVCGQAGTLTLRIAQSAETNGFEAGGSTIDITINKRPNTIKIKGVANYSNSIYVDSYDNELTLTADNTDYTNCPITNTQTAGSDVATFYQNEKVVYSSYKLGTATWNLSQPENYKYQAGSGSFTVNVIKQQEATDCYVLEEAGHDWGTYGEKNYTLQESGVKLKYEIRRTKIMGVSFNGGWFVRYSADGSNWKEKTLSTSDTDNWYADSVTIDEDTRYIKFVSEAPATGNHAVRNVKVTRKTWLKTDKDELIINETSLQNSVFPMSDEPGVGTLKIDYSLANGGDLKIVNDNSKFTLSATEIQDVDCKSSSPTININYSSDVAGKDTAHLVIYNKVYRKEVVLYGETVKRSPEIVWKANFDKMSMDTYEDEAASTDAPGLTVRYISDNTDVITVTEDGTRLNAVGEGTAKITAYTEETAVFKADSIDKNIEVTADLVQYIVWDQSLMGMKLGGTKTLNAYATSDVTECTTNGERPIVYSSNDESIVTIVGNVLTAVGVGTTTVTAKQEMSGVDADGHKYATATRVKTVVVRDPNAPCDADPIYTQTSEIDLFSMELAKPQLNYDIDLTSINGKPDKISFYCKGEPYKVVSFSKEHYEGELKVAQNIGGQWYDVVGGNVGKPSTDKWDHHVNIQLDSAATVVRIYRPQGGEGHHKIRDAQITLKRYIQGTPPATFVAKVGETQYKSMLLEYSNIVGPISISMQSGANSSFSVDKGMEDPIDGNCGDVDAVTLNVKYSPKAANENETETMIVTDGTTTVNITLTGVATVTDRSIVWTQGDENGVVNAYTVETPKLMAYAEDESHNIAGTVHYGLNTGNTAGASLSVVGSDTILSFTSAGQVYVTAYPTQDARYNTPSSVTKRFDVAITPTTISTLPTIQGTIYGGTAPEDVVLADGVAKNTVNNETVNGTFKVISPTTLNAGTYDLTVEFTPENENMYTGCTATLENVTIAQRTPEESELGVNVGTIIYGQRIDEASMTNTGSLAGKWYWKDEDANKEVKAVGTYDNLNVYFEPENTNYATVYSTVSVTVNQAEPSGYSASAANITVGQQVSNSIISNTGIAGNWAWVNPQTTYNVANTYNVEARFTPENTNYYSVVTTLSLTVVPATNIFTNATENGDWDDPENWQSGIVPSSDPNIFVTGDLVIDEDITVGNLTIESTGSVAVISGGTLTVKGTSEDRTEYGDVHVMSDGALALGNSADLQVRDFTIDASLGNSSNAGTSGQVSGEVNLHVNRNAYFQMSFDPDNKISYGWYDFTVPFEVEVLNGIYDDHMNKLTNGVDYLVMNFSEARRASSGKGWGSFTGTMQPGRIYSIGFDETRVWNTFIFKKKSGSITLSDGSYDVEYSNAGAADDRGWNGLGNGTLQHRELTGMGSRKVQVYNHSADNYSAYDADEKAYAVGTAFFLQADEYLSSISLTTTDGLKALHAPKYSGRSLDEFRLTLTAEGADRYTDRMWVSASDEATGEYVIGRDLIKMGAPTDSKVAQMWAINNDLRLCDIEMPMMNDKAQCTLGLFAPQAQTYTLAVDQAPEDATLYLTYNGRVIWSLTASPYTIDLTQGMTEGYGLRIEARHNAPQVATGMDEVDVDQNGNRKVLIDNMLYILTPEGAMYSVTGEKVK